jgi:hypothetical protein
VTDKQKEMDRIVDLVWKKKAVTDMEVFEAFWDMNDEMMRDYVQNRWFTGRKVGQNHITRKLGHFWTQIAGACERMRNELRSDPTYPKVWQVVNYKMMPFQLGYVQATTRSEALSKFDYLFPVFESEGRRIVEPDVLMPAAQVSEAVLRKNAEAAQLVSARVSECVNLTAKYTLLGEQARLRLDAMAILLSMQALHDEVEEEIPHEEAVAQDDHESAED